MPVVINGRAEPVTNFFEGTAPRQEINVGTVPVELFPKNIERIGLVITNYGNKNAWLSWDNVAEAEKGIPLPKNATEVFDIEFIGKGTLSAVTLSGTTNIAWQEMNRT